MCAQRRCRQVRQVAGIGYRRVEQLSGTGRLSFGGSSARDRCILFSWWQLSLCTKNSLSSFALVCLHGRPRHPRLSCPRAMPIAERTRLRQSIRELQGGLQEPESWDARALSQNGPSICAHPERRIPARPLGVSRAAQSQKRDHPHGRPRWTNIYSGAAVVGGLPASEVTVRGSWAGTKHGPAFLSSEEGPVADALWDVMPTAVQSGCEGRPRFRHLFVRGIGNGETRVHVQTRALCASSLKHPGTQLRQDLRLKGIATHVCVLVCVCVCVHIYIYRSLDPGEHNARRADSIFRRGVRKFAFEFRDLLSRGRNGMRLCQRPFAASKSW